MGRSSAGAVGLGTLLVLLLLLGAAGAWNYQRNRAAERAEVRPYRGLAEADLAALEAALEAEVESHAARYRAATGRPVQVADPQLLAEQVREFERVQAISESTRQLGRALAEREGSLRRVRQEQRQRETERDRLGLFLRRLLTVRD